MQTGTSPLVRRVLRHEWAIALALCGVPHFGLAQNVSASRLPAAVDLPYEFEHVTAVRELSDGRLLVVDAHARELLVVDWWTKSADVVGRNGRGPGEYESISDLVPLCGDSTLVPDGTLRRVLRMADARIVRTGAVNDTLVLALGQISGGDETCRVLGARGTARWGTDPLFVDSAWLLLADAAGGPVDTVGRVRGGGARPHMVRRTSPSGGVRSDVAFNPLRVAEQALLFSDGWIALARLDPYRVDWRTPEGRIVHGAPIPVAQILVTDSIKRTALAQQLGRAADDWPPSSFDDWPLELPPYPRRALIAAPDGRLLVRRRTASGDAGVQYDVIDRTGARSAIVSVGATQHLVGAGARDVYIVREDDDGIEHLSQVPWPLRAP